MMGIELLNPKGLWLLTGLVPLIALYILKIRRTRLKISSTWLWAEARRDLLEVTMDASAIEAYLERLNKLIFGLRALAKKTRATYVRVPTDTPILEAVRRFVARTVD